MKLLKEPRFDIGRRQRSGKEEPLTLLTAQFLKPKELLSGFDPFGDRGNAKLRAKGY